MTRFTTVDDAANHIYELDPGFDVITRDELRDIVKANSAGRYEDITEDEITAMYKAAMDIALAR